MHPNYIVLWLYFFILFAVGWCVLLGRAAPLLTSGGVLSAAHLPAGPVVALWTKTLAVWAVGGTIFFWRRPENPVAGLILWPLDFLSSVAPAQQFLPRSNRTSQQGAYLSSTQLQNKTVDTNCKKGFLCSCSTTHLRHCIPGFYIKLWKFLFCRFAFIWKQLKVWKCLLEELIEMCFRYTARLLWPLRIQTSLHFFNAFLWGHRTELQGVYF